MNIHQQKNRKYFNKDFNKSLGRGFTLVEVMVVTLIFTIIVIGLTKFERDIFYLNSIQNGALSSGVDAQSILRTMVKELRSASPGSDGSYPIVTAGTSTLTFFDDINGDGIKEEITYSLASTTFKKTVIEPTGVPLSYPINASGTVSILASNVRNGTSTNVFDYFDTNYTGTSSPLAQPVTIPSIRLVRITLTLDTNPNLPPPAVTYTTQVSLRNLKNNL